MIQALRRSWLRLYAAWLRGAVTVGPVRPQVALTFDDGPDDRWTPEILDILADHSALATFFMLGAQVERHPVLARKVAAAGHELGIHLFSHDPAAADDDGRFMDELTRTRELIRDAAGVSPGLLRFPFAHLGRQRPRRLLTEHELVTAHWSFSSLDSRLGAGNIERRVSKRLMPGAIVLLHDGVGPNSKYVKTRRATVEALPGILAACGRRDLAPVGMSELLSKS